VFVFDAMTRLPADWVIFHSCKEDYLEDEHYIHYEADFVVLVPQKGIVVVEVKDWPQMRLLHGRWQSRKNDHGSWKTHTHAPLEQANIALQKIMRSLTRCGCLPQAAQRWPEHRHMAILTQGTPPDGGLHNLPFDSLYLCGAESLQHLQQRIEELFVLDQPERMSTHRMQKITEALAPSVRFHVSLSTYLQEMDSASANLLNILPALYESTGGIRVEGCAGTGKTVMACAEAARLAAEFPRNGTRHVLMLCFNHAMAAELQHNPMLEEQGDSIIISTFHDFCISHLLAPHGKETLINIDGPGDRLTQDAVESIMNLMPVLPHFDYIFVDEAQDFRASWWSIIQNLLAKDGKLYIFADKNQDLYNRYHHLPELATRIQLSGNLRNACQIASFSHAMLPAEYQETPVLPMSGAGVHLCSAGETPEERAAEVQRIISRLLESADPAIHPCDIVVLSPWRTSHHRCCLNLVQGLATAPADESPAEASARRAACRQTNSTRIFASTIKSFKGQEAAYIIVADIIGLGESQGFDIKELYTACTRARYGLYLVPTESGKSLAESFLA
jgi:hypothetical protein